MRLTPSAELDTATIYLDSPPIPPIQQRGLDYDNLECYICLYVLAAYPKRGVMLFVSCILEGDQPLNGIWKIPPDLWRPS